MELPKINEKHFVDSNERIKCIDNAIKKLIIQSNSARSKGSDIPSFSEEFFKSVKNYLK